MPMDWEPFIQLLASGVAGRMLFCLLYYCLLYNYETEPITERVFYLLDIYVIMNGRKEGDNEVCHQIRHDPSGGSA